MKILESFSPTNNLIQKISLLVGLDLNYAAYSTAWLSILNLLTAAISLISVVIFTRVFTPQEYGLYKFVFVIASLLGALTLTGMNTAVTLAVAKEKEAILKEAVRVQIIFGTLPLLVGISLSLFYFISQNLFLGSTVLLLSLVIPVSNAFNTYSALFLGRKDFKHYSVITFVVFFIPMLVSIVALILRLGLFAVISSYFISTLLFNIFIYKLIIQKFPTSLAQDQSIIKTGIYQSILNCLNTVAQYLDSILVWHFLGSESLAMYSLAISIPEQARIFFKFIPSLAMPKLVHLSVDEINSFLPRKVLYFSLVIVLGIVGYYFLAPTLFHLFFPKYNQAIPLTQLAGLNMISIVPGVMGTALVAKQRHRRMGISGVTTPIVQIALTFGFGYYLGLVGLILARIATQVFIIIENYFLLVYK
ncbi:oligosaccharide flippase family protein [Patescibacteria group bacterium]|nr:oligosaccharide flippase family protein [Patescibacteria group bacterium]